MRPRTRPLVCSLLLAAATSSAVAEPLDRDLRALRREEVPERGAERSEALGPPRGIAVTSDEGRSRERFESLLELHDLVEGSALAPIVARAADREAAQRYATESRLYWHTDLDAAKRESASTARPILSLRLLGRLDEELSCANSRLFRAILYPDASVSKLLRERFVLHWSSERPVPRVTIDFGDGRRIETTTTGNSAHYVLDARGDVVDVLPGLYTPAAFHAELVDTLALAERLDAVPAVVRDATLRLHHAARAQPSVIALPDPTTGKVASELVAAQRVTVAKEILEVPLLRVVVGDRDLGLPTPDDVATWHQVGRRTWAGTHLLDASSRALVARLHRGDRDDVTDDELRRVIARLERHALADSALNQYVVRRRISDRIAQHGGAFDALNAWVYTFVFRTPREDAWLGLLPRTDFTGLPGDGVRRGTRGAL